MDKYKTGLIVVTAVFVGMGLAPVQVGAENYPLQAHNNVEGTSLNHFYQTEILKIASQNSVRSNPDLAPLASTQVMLLMNDKDVNYAFASGIVSEAIKNFVDKGATLNNVQRIATVFNESEDRHGVDRGFLNLSMAVEKQGDLKMAMKLVDEGPKTVAQFKSVGAATMAILKNR